MIIFLFMHAIAPKSFLSMETSKDQLDELSDEQLLKNEIDKIITQSGNDVVSANWVLLIKKIVPPNFLLLIELITNEFTLDQNIYQENFVDKIDEIILSNKVNDIISSNLLLSIDLVVNNLKEKISNKEISEENKSQLQSLLNKLNQAVYNTREAAEKITQEEIKEKITQEEINNLKLENEISNQCTSQEKVDQLQQELNQTKKELLNKLTQLKQIQKIQVSLSNKLELLIQLIQAQVAVYTQSNNSILNEILNVISEKILKKISKLNVTLKKNIKIISEINIKQN